MKEGYKNVHALVGGLYAYKDAGGEVVQAATPTPAPDATKPATNLGGIAGAAPVKSNN